MDDLQQGIDFLSELAAYFLENRERDFLQIKNHVAGILVEILVPVANVSVMKRRNKITPIHFSKSPLPRRICPH